MLAKRRKFVNVSFMKEVCHASQSASSPDLFSMSVISASFLCLGFRRSMACSCFAIRRSTLSIFSSRFATRSSSPSSRSRSRRSTWRMAINTPSISSCAGVFELFMRSIHCVAIHAFEVERAVQRCLHQFHELRRPHVFIPGFAQHFQHSAPHLAHLVDGGETGEY